VVEFDTVAVVKLVSTILGILAPVGSLIYFSGVVVQRIKNLEALLTRLLQQQSECHENRETAESRLRDRCGSLDARLSHLEGRCDSYHG
jgi:hypothetical protein